MTRLHRLPLAAALLALALAPRPAAAVAEPPPGPKDSRVRSLPYDAQQVVRLTSTGLSPLQVIFEAGEKPLTIAGALVVTDPKEAKDWLARPSGNVLILQPLRQMEPSVLFVRTATVDGKERHYALELRTREGNLADPADKAAYMVVRFAYKAAPVPPSPEAIAAWRARRDAQAAFAADSAAKLRLAAVQNQGARNYNYDKQDDEGCPVLAPAYVFDNGTRTTMVFSPNAVLPQLYIVNQDGKEAIVTAINDSTPNGLQVVIPSVHREMRLRRGGKVCALRNNGFDPVGQEPGGGSGTISPDVIRQVRAP